MKPFSVEIRSNRGIPLDVRLAARHLVHWLRETQPVPHRVIVSLVAEPAIQAGEVFAFGCFKWPNGGRSHGRVVWIHAAAGMVDVVVEQTGDTRQGGIDALLHTILHEWVHYEQWRDGREPTERGVQRRANSLLAAFEKSSRRESAVP